MEPHTTVHHVHETNVDYQTLVRYSEHEPDESDLYREYRPAETILGVTDPEEAFRHAQGEIVNREQGGRHMVHSAMPSDVFEVYDGETYTYYLCNPIGFTELDIDGPIDTKRETPHA